MLKSDTHIKSAPTYEARIIFSNCLTIYNGDIDDYDEILVSWNTNHFDICMKCAQEDKATEMILNKVLFETK